MRDNLKHYAVNWVDGMKISKDHFIAQDDAWKDALYDTAVLCTSPLRYGILPPSSAGEETFNVKISTDNQKTIRVAVLSCKAVTPGGIRINLPTLAAANTEADGVPAVSVSLADIKGDTDWWVVLTVHPFEKLPAGIPDLSEDPPRYPRVTPSYSVQVINGSQYNEYAYHPYALVIGKLSGDVNHITVDEEYLPPCYSISASSELLSLHAELDQFMTRLEVLCLQIVQKIYEKNQQNEISELVFFLSDRMVLFFAPAITNMRWTMIHDSPAKIFETIASLARVMKNTIDLRIGSGKDEMLTYLGEWCELRQGELESILNGVAAIRFDNNDVNKNIVQITLFIKATIKLFETLNKLEFIGKRKDSGLFIKEEKEPVKKHRFLG